MKNEKWEWEWKMRIKLRTNKTKQIFFNELLN